MSHVDARACVCGRVSCRVSCPEPCGGRRIRRSLRTKKQQVVGVSKAFEQSSQGRCVPMVPFLSTSNTRISLTAVSKPAETRRQPSTKRPRRRSSSRRRQGFTDRNAADGNVGQLVSADRPAGGVRHPTTHHDTRHTGMWVSPGRSGCCTLTRGPATAAAATTYLLSLSMLMNHWRTCCISCGLI